eukprot:Nitzschia sp. Nitz4//scaffold36_size144017//65193//66074//NITZ4_003091-RA/size144017-processed-gene-0.267-mRNA-1//-1//CDS//3329549471//3339//frame0
MLPLSESKDETTPSTTEDSSSDTDASTTTAMEETPMVPAVLDADAMDSEASKATLNAKLARLRCPVGFLDRLLMAMSVAATYFAMNGVPAFVLAKYGLHIPSLGWASSYLSIPIVLKSLGLALPPVILQRVVQDNWGSGLSEDGEMINFSRSLCMSGKAFQPVLGLLSGSILALALAVGDEWLGRGLFMPILMEHTTPLAGVALHATILTMVEGAMSPAHFITDWMKQAYLGLLYVYTGGNLFVPVIVRWAQEVYFALETQWFVSRMNEVEINALLDYHQTYLASKHIPLVAV